MVFRWSVDMQFFSFSIVEEEVPEAITEQLL